jgi:hypothetical protein
MKLKLSELAAFVAAMFLAGLGFAKWLLTRDKQ